METSSDVDMQQRTQQKNNEKKNDKIKYTHQIVIYIQYHTYITRGNQLIALENCGLSGRKPQAPSQSAFLSIELLYSLITSKTLFYFFISFFLICSIYML